MGESDDFGGSKAVAITGKITILAIIVLFLVVIFVLFLHLYAKWFWWRIEEQHPPPIRRRRRRFVFATGQETSLYVRSSKGLDSAVLASLPLLVFRQEDFKDGLECAVCLCELEEGEKARLLPKCNHGFHVDCIDMWFQSHSTCPLCRNPVAGFESEDSSSVDSVDVHLESSQQNSSSGHSAESPVFPTNVLFWGNETQVSSVGVCLEEGISASPSFASFPSSSSSGNGSSSNRPEGMLVIDVPTNVNENLTEGESKSPMPTRLRSLKRLLSRENRVAPNCSSSSSLEA